MTMRLLWRWRTLILVVGAPLIGVIILFVSRGADGQSDVEIREGTVLLSTVPPEDALRWVEETAGFKPSLATDMPARGMALRFIDLIGLKRLDDPFVELVYANARTSISVRELPVPRTPSGRPHEIGGVPGASVWWSPFSDSQHFYMVRTSSRYLVIEVSGSVPSQGEMLGLIRSVSAP